MERQDGRVSDHGRFFVAGMLVFGLLAFLASRSAVVLHKFELPFLLAQAKIFSKYLLSEEYQTELHRIENILRIVDGEVAKRGGYARIRAGALRKAMLTSSKRTRNTTRFLTCILLCLLGLPVVMRAVRANRRLYDHRENVLVQTRKGVEGFLAVTGRHLDPDRAVRLRNMPTAENLADAFSAVRMRVNIPCSLVARLFPRGTKERMVLLGYGKERVAFAVEKTADRVGGNKEREEI